MKIRTILHSPKRAAAVVAVAGLLSAAGASGSGAAQAHAVPAQARQDTAVASTKDVNTLWKWLAALPAARRNDVIIAIVPDVRGALQTILRGMISPAVGH